MISPPPLRVPVYRDLVGVDIFFDDKDRNPNHSAEKPQRVTQASGLELAMITNHGVKI